MRVLVTRTIEDATHTAQELAKRGHEALIAPLSETRLLNFEEPDLTHICAILATSSNGVRAFARRSSRRDIPIFAVGSTTAATAHDAGFLHVTNAAGDASTLVELVGRSVKTGAGALLHVAGTNSAPGFRERITEAGFDLRTWELYETVYRAEFPREIVDAFRRCAVDSVLVLSPESGRTLVRCLLRAELSANCLHVVACCISAATAATLKGAGFGLVRIAEKPDLESVLALLDLGTVGAHT